MHESDTRICSCSQATTRKSSLLAPLCKPCGSRLMTWHCSCRRLGPVPTCTLFVTTCNEMCAWFPAGGSSCTMSSMPHCHRSAAASITLSSKAFASDQHESLAQHACITPTRMKNITCRILAQYDDLPKRLLRSAVIGFAASATSDTCSNSIRVIKTTKQTSKVPFPCVPACLPA